MDPAIVSSFARYIENVFEELDAAGEYFYNTTTEKLYFYHNGTGAPTDDVVFEAAVNQTIVSLKGTQADPVTATQFVGLTFKDSAYVGQQQTNNPNALASVASTCFLLVNTRGH